MHEPVKGRLEEYLGGNRIPEVEAHLERCESCREEVAIMLAHSGAFRALRVRPEIDPAPGFYARVTERIQKQQAPSVWSLFSESLFATRFAFASVALFVMLFGFFFASADLVEPEETFAAHHEHTLNPHPDDQQVKAENEQADREAVLVSLVSYGRN